MTKTLDELEKLIGQYADSNRRSQGPDSQLWLQIGDALRELSADAERYRWLRTGEHRNSEPDVFDELGRHLLEMEALDVAIDAAMTDPLED